jgi:phosphate:Na+ symporter
MTVGFVNSGIMKLKQTVGIILGANIGTTVTAWLLSLNSIEGTGILMTLVKPTSFSPILAIIGVILIFTSKSEKKHLIAGILLGFTILIYGMDFMSSAVEPFTKYQAFKDVLISFGNPIVGIIVGALFTALIQSSSASVGILQALATTGIVPWKVAIPVIFGQNIGTCITALLASVGTSRNAKRVALVHLYYNCICSVVGAALIFGWNEFQPIALLADDSYTSSAGIALCHSVFNISGAIIFLIIPGSLTWLAEKTIPSSDSERERDKKRDDFSIIENKFFLQKSFAVPHFVELEKTIANLVHNTLNDTVLLFSEYEPETAKAYEITLKRTENYERTLGDNIIAAQEEDTDSDTAAKLSELLQKLSEFEGITKANISIFKAYEVLFSDKNSAEFREKEKHDLGVLFDSLSEIVSLIEQVVSNENESTRETCVKVLALNDTIDKQAATIKKRRLKRMQQGKFSVETCFRISEIVTYVKNISSRCINIAHVIIGEPKADTFVNQALYHKQYNSKYTLKDTE